jgi:hypothetical protein
VDLLIEPAVEGDAAALASLRAEVAEGLTRPIRLDAYDGPAGAGGFYAKRGFREVGRVVYRGTPLVYFERILP